MFDAMHVCLTSGGVLQYAANALIRTLLGKGFLLDQLDAFHEYQLTAKGLTWRIRPRFFTTKYNAKVNSHLKGFAADTITAIETLFHGRVSRRRRPAPPQAEVPLAN